MWMVVVVCTWLSLVVILTVLELVKEQVARPVRNSLQVRECAEEGESSWKEPCSYHRAQRFPVQSIAEAQGKGG
jgi:hypothetical protein